MNAMTIVRASELQAGYLIQTSNRFGFPALRAVVGIVDGPDDNAICVKLQSPHGPVHTTMTYDKNDLVSVTFDPENPVIVSARPAGLFAFEATDSLGRVFRRGVCGRLCGCTVKNGAVELHLAYGGEDINPPTYGTETWNQQKIAGPRADWEWDTLADSND